MYKEIVEKLIQKRETISTMESCTGGAVANEITNVEGASSIFSFSAVTYSNEAKTRMGVSKDIIDMYSVYSKETAEAMAKAISLFTDSTYGIGITGKMGTSDPSNSSSSDNLVFISIYNKKTDDFDTTSLSIDALNREERKKVILNLIKVKLSNVIGV